MAGAPLDLALTELAAGRLPEVNPQDWDALDSRAAEHRLRPLLHHFHAGTAAIPQTLRVNWAQAYRDSAIDALLHRHELLRLTALLSAQGLQPVALKGAALAWHAWPDPALRPLRDLDLFLPGESALRARETLLVQGWQQEEDQGFAQLGAEGWLARFKALPPLFAPSGVAVDIHARLWDADGRSPPPPASLLGDARTDPEHPQLRYPGASDQLMHLAVHAVLHRFDGGPLMLHDFGHLLRTETLDWPRVWSRAASEGWDRSLALCLAGARRWSGIEAQWPALPLEVPEALVRDLPLLLAKPEAARDGDIATAKLARRDIGWVEKARRVAARRKRYSGPAQFVQWAGREAFSVLRSRAGGDGRAATIAALDDWIGA